MKKRAAGNDAQGPHTKRMATALDATARTATKAIEAGRMPSELDRPVVLSLLMRDLASPGASAAAVEGASGALVQLLEAEDGAAAAAAAELLAAGALPALAGALGATGRAPGAAARVLLSLALAAGDTSARLAMIGRMADTDGMLSGLMATLQNEDDPEPAECRTLTAHILSMLAFSEGAVARIAALPDAAATLATAALSVHATGAACLHMFVTLLLQIAGEGAARAWTPEAMTRVVDVMALAADEVEVELAGLAMITLQRLALAADAAPRIAAHPAAMRAMAKAAVGAEDTDVRGAAEAALRAVARCDVEAKAAVASALAARLVAGDAASRGRARALLRAAPLSLPSLAVAALEGAVSLAAGEVAALKAEVEELWSIPVNTRAAIVELATAVRGRPG
ncbi:hypothetical protein MNEG_11035 [Monoraphidium neglectum]|uniref:Uncharacterized protein n=1 Tax=Monoraphidium neglectum TaxID=145388 RepID=A0A0D2JB03_9CHLO|nr:hypothetical protein MNEG_11035 [Monoraphidium neglectum]KIY96927.1 hypothetical protein MNEG_11035 [Monoraphidium neglectum]|eukprot:XP_013895947.1 hypothetical protein MNEG_11035 [Monoraphidium neglectum]